MGGFYRHDRHNMLLLVSRSASGFVAISGSDKNKHENVARRGVVWRSEAGLSCGGQADDPSLRNDERAKERGR